MPGLVGDEGAGADEADLGAHLGEEPGVRAGDAGVLDVADDGDLEALQAPLRSRMVRASPRAWVGCSCWPSPAFRTGPPKWRAARVGSRWPCGA